MRTICSLGLLLLLIDISAVSAQTGLVIVSAYANEITVDGNTDSDSGQIIILDTSYDVETPIGRGNVLNTGKFAIMVTPPIVEGHGLIAIDENGHRSPVFSAVPARSGSLPAPQ